MAPADGDPPKVNTPSMNGRRTLAGPESGFYRRQIAQNAVRSCVTAMSIGAEFADLQVLREITCS